MKELMRISFYMPNTGVPFYFLTDFIDVMCTEYCQERSELIHALHKDRKLCDLPKIIQASGILGENAQLVFIKNAGHSFNIEKCKKLFKHLKSFIIDPCPSLETTTMAVNHIKICAIKMKRNQELLISELSLL